MATYKSKAVTVNKSATELAEKFSDFSSLGSALENLPAEERAKVGDVSFTADTITISTPQVGDIRLKAIERTLEKIRLKAEGTPVDMELEINFKPVNESQSSVEGAINVDLPLVIRPLVGPTLQKAVDQFGELFAKLA